jgi:cold shock CspA family protein
MKRILAVVAAAMLCLSAASWAAAQEPEKGSGDQKSKSVSAKTVQGTIVKVDNDQKMLVIRDDSGTSTTVYWDSTTQMGSSDLKEGQTVSVATTERNGKTFATSIQASAKKPY